MHFTSILLHSFGSFADADVGRIKSPSRPKNQNVEYRTLNHHIAMSLNVTFVSVTGCSRDGLDVYRPLAAPPVGAPGRERAEEELLRREAVARPDRHRRRHCRCRLPSDNNVLCRLVFHCICSPPIVQLYSPPGTLRPSRPSRGPCLRSGKCGAG